MRISDWSSYVCSSDLDAGFCKIKNNFRVSEFDPGIIVVEILPFKLLIQIFFYIVARFGTVPAFCRSLPGIKAGCLISSGVNEGAGLNTSRSEEHTSELQSLMRNSYAVFCLKKKTT